MRNSANLIPAILSTLLMLGATTGNTQTHQQTLRLDNDSTFGIHQVYISQTGDPSWGRDLLGESLLPSTRAITFRLPGANSYDVKLVDEDGDTCIRTLFL